MFLCATHTIYTTLNFVSIAEGSENIHTSCQRNLYAFVVTLHRNVHIPSRKMHCRLSVGV